MKIKRSMQKKIFALSLALVLIPLLLFSILNITVSIRNARENYENSLILNMKNIGSVVDGMFSDVQRTSLFIIGDKTIKNFLLSTPEQKREYTKTVGMSPLYNSLNYLNNTSDSVYSIQILGLDDYVLTHGPMPMYISASDAARARELNGRAFWGVDQTIGFRGAVVNHIYQCRLLRDPLKLSTNVGIVKIYLDNAALSEFFRSELLSGTSYYIADTSGNILYSTASEAESRSIPPYDMVKRHLAGVFTYDGCYVAPHRIAENDWIAYSLSVPVGLQMQMRTSITLLTLLALMCFVFCIMLALITSRRLTRPLHSVVAYIQRFESDFSIRVPVRGEDEIALLAYRFNSMAEHIQYLVNRVYLNTIRRKELELGALQAQVNPHFLYNTLDMVYWTAKMEGAPETSGMIDSLSNFFRRALSEPGEYTTLENEIEHLRYYVLLRQQGKKPFDFDLEAEDGILDCRVVKLVLQPLVENAILHGLRDLQHGSIRVRVFREDGDLVYTVADNGPGLDIDDVSRLLIRAERNHRGFGLKNINDRIKLAYGDAYGLQFSNTPEGGATIRVLQPCRKGATNDDQADDRG